MSSDNRSTPKLEWLKAPDGAFYTTPRSFTIEPLQNGLWLLYHYGSGLTSSHEDLLSALLAAEAMNVRAAS